MKCVRTAIVVTSAILIASTSFADVAWTGAGTDRNWDNPANWVELVDGAPTGPNRVPEAADDAYVNGPYASGGNIPLIADGMEAICGVLVTEAGTCTIEMTGGHLELAGWGSWLGDGVDNTATFDMSGGTVDYTGNPGILECGWQPSDSPAGSCTGMWVMTGGVVNAKGISLPGGGGGVGEIHLDGGRLNVGTARGGLVFDDDWPDSASFDITEGILVLEGDEQVRVAGYAGDGRLTAYEGAGYLICDYNIRQPMEMRLPSLCSFWIWAIQHLSYMR